LTPSGDAVNIVHHLLTKEDRVAVNPETTDRKVIQVPKEMSRRIARYRFGNEINAESEAIRRLIEKGLEAAEAEGRTEGGASA
jgi:hypothetical protein